MLVGFVSVELAPFHYHVIALSYQFSARLNRHYELMLDAKADSFLGIKIEHRDDGTLLHTQLKLLQKLFKEHPEKIGKCKARTLLHPYRPAPAHNATTSKEQSGNKVLSVAGAFDILNQESTRLHDGCLLRGY